MLPLNPRSFLQFKRKGTSPAAARQSGEVAPAAAWKGHATTRPSGPHHEEHGVSVAAKRLPEPVSSPASRLS